MLFLEEGNGLCIRLNLLGVARHKHAHEVFGFAVRFIALNQNRFNFFVVKISDRPFDQAAFLVHKTRRIALQGQISDVFPKPQQIFKVTFDFRFSPFSTRCPYNEAHAACNIQALSNRFETLTVSRVSDLARDAAATSSVRHQNAIATCQGQIGCQSSALITALFFNNLHQNDLATLDHVLNFVRPISLAFPAWTDFFSRIFRASRFNRCGWFCVVTVISVFFRRVRSSFGYVRTSIIVFCRVAIFIGFGSLSLNSSFSLLFQAHFFCLRTKEFFPVSRWDLVVVRMNFTKSKEAMAVATVIHKGRLKRWLHTCDLS